MIRFKGYLLGIVTGLIIAGGVSYAGEGLYQLSKMEASIWADGQRISMLDAPILNYNGSSYVPLRKLSEITGTSVIWDASTQSINLTSSTKEVIKEVPKEVIREVEDKKITQSIKDKVIIANAYEWLYNLYGDLRFINNNNLQYMMSVLFNNEITSDKYFDSIHNDLANYNSKINDYIEIYNKTFLPASKRLNVDISDINSMINDLKSIRDESQECYESIYNYSKYKTEKDFQLYSRNFENVSNSINSNKAYSQYIKYIQMATN